MRRGARFWGSVAVLVVTSSSLALAAVPSIDTSVVVGDGAIRVSPPDEATLDPLERAEYDLIGLVNDERARRGLPILFQQSRVSRAARAHAADMATQQVMQHAGSDGSDAGDRLRAAGYSWSTWGENIGAGFTDPAVLFEAWMRSPSHRAFLLGDFADIGVGAAVSSSGAVYWALVVATP